MEGTNAKEYRNKVEELLQILPNIEDQHVEAIWEDIKEAICETADNILGQKPRMVRNGWYHEECQERLEDKKTARLKMLQRKTRSNIEANKEARREARKVFRKNKKYYEEEKLEELQEKYKRNALKQFYEGIHKIRTGFQPRTTMCKNKQGAIVGEEKHELEVSATYFKELLNPKFNMTTSEGITYFGPESNIVAPTIQETLGVIGSLKNNRASGEDSVTSKLIKY
jgi:hypothetical protein